MQIKVNVSKSLKGLNSYLPTIEKAVTNALMQTGFEILKAAEPKAPIDEGTLIGSGYVQVGKKNLSQKATSQRPSNTDIKDSELRVGYTVDYAEKLHENPFNPGAKSIQKGLEYPGYKWLKNAADSIDIKNKFKDFLDDELG